MNLQTHINPELWRAISSTYEAENYTHAILEAIHFLSDTIRDKADLEGDGAALVGSAVGGKSPKLKINNFQTETEKSEQEGFFHLLMGLYKGVRNPRSHEQSSHLQDNKDTADTIIYFVDYLIKILDKSKQPFVIDDFVQRVFDPDFVESEKYAKLLADEVPTKQRFDVLLLVYRDKFRGDGEKLSLFIQALLQLLPNSETEDFFAIVSDDLKITTTDREIRLILQILLPEQWPNIGESARLRIENKLLRYFKEGYMSESGRCNPEGALVTWARDFLPYFLIKLEFTSAILDKLKKSDMGERIYVTKYFMYITISLLSNQYQVNRFIQIFIDGVHNDDEFLRETLVDSAWRFPEEWLQSLENKLENVLNDDGTPFFVAAKYDTGDLGDIPF